MIESAISNSPYPEKYLIAKEAVRTNTYQEKGQTVQPEKCRYPVDQVKLTWSSAAKTTYSRSMSLTSKGDGYDLLRGLVLNMFKDQGIDYRIRADNSEIDISTVSPDQAQELIAEEGYFGVEKTSERIFTFAVGMAGGDPARIDAIRQGVENGFQEALEAFGGWLPDISYATYDTVMKKLDDWAGLDVSNNSPESQPQVKS